MTYTIRVFQSSDLPRLQEITGLTFGPVSIDRNMENLFGPFGHGDWQSRKVKTGRKVRFVSASRTMEASDTRLPVTRNASPPM